MKKIVVLLYICLFSFSLFAEESDYTNEEKKVLLDEHCFGGVPDDGKVWTRTGYIMQYDTENNIARWVGYHIDPEYLDTPSRSGKWKTYRNDPDFDSEGSNDSYTRSGYARGHLAPYFISGGDRDDDGKSATEDEDDKRTVYEVNYFTNLTPQNQNAFNGSGGIWYKLETFVRLDLLKGRRDKEPLADEVWVYAGTIISEGEKRFIGDGSDAKPHVRIPSAYFKILVIQLKEIEKPVILAFLMPHYLDNEEVRGLSFTQFLVPVDTIELLTGLDFFQEMNNEEKIEQENSSVAWAEFFE